MIERLRRALVDLLNRHRLDNALPTNIRFLFYELEMLGLDFKRSPLQSEDRERTHPPRRVNRDDRGLCGGGRVRSFPKPSNRINRYSPSGKNFPIAGRVTLNDGPVPVRARHYS